MVPQTFEFLAGYLNQKIFWESVDIPLDRSFESLGFYSVKLRQEYESFSKPFLTITVKSFSRSLTCIFKISS
jgi:hypothetical protein